MSPNCRSFLEAVIRGAKPQALVLSRSLDMLGLLRGLAALDPEDLEELRKTERFLALANRLPNFYDPARFAYALSVIDKYRARGTPVATKRNTKPVKPAEKQSASLAAQLFSLQVPPHDQGNAWVFLTNPNMHEFEFDADVRGVLPAPAKNTAAITEHDYADLGRELNLEARLVKAVSTVESSGVGAFGGPEGRPTVRFELHRFQQYTSHRYDQTHPHLSNSYSAGKGKPYHIWSSPEANQRREWSMLFAACALRNCWEAACLSSSWGPFQIMGENYADGGWSSIGAFVRAMHESGANHIRAFLGYCKKNRLVGLLQGKKWLEFATVYNGPAKAPSYAAEMEKAYKGLGG